MKMTSDEAWYWLQCDRDDAMFCVGCGHTVHRDFCDISEDDEAMCHDCARFEKAPLDTYGLRF